MANQTYGVLIVDDEKDILNALHRDLRKEPYKKFFANSGEEAMKLMAENKDIAVVVTDMRMPGMNGLELLSKIHAINPMTVKIVLTGYTQLPQVLATVNKIDIYKFLTKPWNIDTELKVYIEEAIALYQNRIEVENKVKSQEEKNKIFNKILIESYLKADHLTHLYEELLQSINHHHLLTVQEMRKIKSDEAYEYQLGEVISNMKNRMHYLNKVFDVSKFGVKSFDGNTVKLMVDSICRQYQIDVSKVVVQTTEVLFQDNIKLLSTLLTDLIESVVETKSKIGSLNLNWGLEEAYGRLEITILSEPTEAYVSFSNSKGRFMKSVVKTLGGDVSFNLEKSPYEVKLILRVQLKKATS